MDWGRFDRTNMLLEAQWSYEGWRRLLLLFSVAFGTQILVIPESFALSVNPSQMTFTATAGAGAPANQTLSLTNSSSGEYQCESSASWLTLSTNYGTFSGDPLKYLYLPTRLGCRRGFTPRRFNFGSGAEAIRTPIRPP